METKRIVSQLVVNNENLLSEVSIDSKYVIYSGLGHVVLDSNIRNDNKEIFDKILNSYECFFRISITEDIKSNEYEKHLFLIDKDKKLKSKKLNNTDNIVILGSKFYEIILKYLGKSQNENFQKVQHYECTINEFSIDQETGEISTEKVWNRVKYGNIESFLPYELKDTFSEPIESMRKFFYKTFQ